MSRRSASALTVLLAAALAGCGTGLEARTYLETGREDGVAADLGGSQGIAIRNLHVAPPGHGTSFALGASVTVLGGLVNNSTTADALVGASSDIAASASLVLDGAPVTSVPVPALGAAATTWGVQLTGLTRALHVGQHIPLTLVFERAGRINLQLPVWAGDNELSEREHAQDPYGGH